VGNLIAHEVTRTGGTAAWSALPGKALLTSLFLIACTPTQLPKPDPLRYEVIILQKQLLEHQKLQLKTKLDEFTSTINRL